MKSEEKGEKGKQVAVESQCRKIVKPLGIVALDSCQVHVKYICLRYAEIGRVEFKDSAQVTKFIPK